MSVDGIGLGELFSWPATIGALGVVGSLLLIFIATVIALRLIQPIVGRLFRIGAHDEHKGLLDERRAKTLAELTGSILRYVIYFAAGVAALDQLGIDTRSLLAAAGVVGLAVGFGAQNLVRDFVTGFFILLEDQYGIGDYVTVAGVSGTVESLGIRTTRIRSFGGEVHIIPNGKIDQVTNHMGDAMRVLFPVRIPYEQDHEYAVEVLEELFEELSGEMENLVDGPQVLGVQDLSDSGVELLIWARAKTMTQWAVTRELRGRALKRLHERGVRIPYGRRYVIFDHHQRELEPVAGRD